MGYMFCFGECYGCKQMFSFNPDLVPSIRVPSTGRKEPICRTCVERVNPERIKNGLQPIVPALGAYEAQECL